MALKLACLVKKNVASALRCGSFSCTSPSLSSLLEFPREERGEEWTQCALRIGRNTAFWLRSSENREEYPD